MSAQPFILHHYEASPYAEKIRLMFGRANGQWASVLSPAMPPRPNVDPLTGGYRRIPVAQVGADIFCDTTLIAIEVAARTGVAELGPHAVPEHMAARVSEAEGDVFFSAITSASPGTVLKTLLKQMGPIGTFRFIRDRSRMMRTASIKPPQGARAQAVFDAFLEALNTDLTTGDYLSGETAGYADFAIYHPIWLKNRIAGEPIDRARYPQVLLWLDRIEAIGHGDRVEMPPAEAFAQAKQSDPRPVPASSNEDDRLHRQVAIGPEDYGQQPVIGELVAVTDERLIVARDTPQFGRLHVHFPVSGYRVEVQ